MKAILVIDMPEKCENCPCLDSTLNMCGAMCRYVRIVEKTVRGKKPDWCPLKPVPEKKVVKQYQGNGVYGFKTAEEAHFAMGWNDCIDEILKGGAVE